MGWKTLFYEISSWKSVGLMKGVGKGLHLFRDLWTIRSSTPTFPWSLSVIKVLIKRLLTNKNNSFSSSVEPDQQSQSFLLLAIHHPRARSFNHFHVFPEISAGHSINDLEVPRVPLFQSLDHHVFPLVVCLADLSAPFQPTRELRSCMMRRRSVVMGCPDTGQSARNCSEESE